jgi:hypothetical protein
MKQEACVELLVKTYENWGKIAMQDQAVSLATVTDHSKDSLLKRAFELLKHKGVPTP